MKRILFFLTLGFLAVGCNSNDPAEQLKHIDGYWEIEKVEFSKDSVRIYRFNEMIDFFEIENGKGFRKKVRPQLDGSYKITQDAEKVEARVEDEQLNLYYTTPYDTWKETIMEAGKNNLSIKTDDGLIYHYKRYIPLLEDEKE